MTKNEIIKALAPFPGKIEVSITDSEGMQIDIKHIDYRSDKEIGKLTIVPMGSHLPKNKIWARLT